MNGTELAAWRVAAGLTQAQLAKAIGVSRPTIARAEGAPDAEVSSRLAHGVAATVQAEKPKKPAPKAAAVVRLPDPTPSPSPVPTFDPIAAGLKPWGPRPANIVERDFKKNPVAPGWQLVSWRVVHGSIPCPIPYYAPDWAGDRGIVSADGRVWDYQTGMEMRDFQGRGIAETPRSASRPTERTAGMSKNAVVRPSLKTRRIVGFDGDGKEVWG